AGAGSSLWAGVGSTKRSPRLTITGLWSQPVSSSAATTSRCRRSEPATAPTRYRPGRSSGRRSSPHAQRGCAASKTRICSIISQVAALHRSGRGGHGTAVDHDLRARDERGVVGREEERAAGDVLRLSYPAQRDPVPVPCRPFNTLDDVGGEPSPDGAGTDRVDADVIAPVGGGHGAREREHRALGGGVGVARPLH